ncbi:MAG: DUF3108 domain-containing protein [Cytophagales bacterium]|nr:DUF3108 domain-containing protein [Cytophagales bacterium]MDW8383936.1 DUF3108 domain-containing protein [Flammeovirgaceae bacterium]
MKKSAPLSLLLTATCVLLGAFSLPSDSGFRVISNNSFHKGEKYVYTAHYGFINIAQGVVELEKSIYWIHNRPCYKVNVSGKTIGMFTSMFKVNDFWCSYIDTIAIVPHKFIREIQENNYRLKEYTYFDHTQRRAIVKYEKGDGKIGTDTFSIKQWTQDLVSGYYYIRTLDFYNLQKGDTITIPAFFEDKSYDFKIKYLGKEILKTEFGKIKTFVMSPIMPENSLFDGENSIRFWISDDENRVPLKVKAKMFVGSFELDLTAKEGMRKEFSIID